MTPAEKYERTDKNKRRADQKIQALETSTTDIQYQVGRTGLYGCARSLAECTGLLPGCVRLPCGNHVVPPGTTIDYQVGTR